jgi:hypothetical protein
MKWMRSEQRTGKKWNCNSIQPGQILQKFSSEKKHQHSAGSMDGQACYVPADRIVIPNQYIEHEWKQHHRSIVQAPERLLHPTAGKILQQEQRLSMQVVVYVNVLEAVVTQKAGEKRWAKTDECKRGKKRSSHCALLIVLDCQS